MHKIFPFYLLLLCSCVAYKAKLEVPSNNAVELSFAEFEAFNAHVKNKSKTAVEVAVKKKKTEETVKAFGLPPRNYADVMVEKGQKLLIKNDGQGIAKIKLYMIFGDMPQANNNEYITFTLKNNTAVSIPLYIPSVMNPNLSPFSESGVSLKKGQKIFFKEKGKKYLLLTVDESIKNEEEIPVSKLIKERKAELKIR